MNKGAVIPSRADGEGPLNGKLDYAPSKEAATTVTGSLAVCATRDDKRFLLPPISRTRI
jgi:hypothetical protein